MPGHFLLGQRFIGMKGMRTHGFRFSALPSVVVYLWLVPLLCVAFEPVAAHDVHRIAQLALLMSATTLMAYQLMATDAPIPVSAQQAAASVLAVVIAIASTMHAAMPHWAAVEACLTLGLVALAIHLGADGSEKTLKQFCWGTLIALGPYYILLIGLLLGIYASGNALMRSEFLVGYSNYRFFNHVQTATLPLLAVAARSEQLPNWARRTAFGLLAFGFAVLVFTAARGTMTGLTIGAAFAALGFGRPAIQWLKRFGAAAAVGTALYALLFLGVPAMLGLETEMAATELVGNARSIDLRYFLWDLAVQYTRESPFLGIGPMHFAHRPNFEAAHPHNLPLQIAAEWGVPMLLLVAAALIWAMTRMFKSLRQERDHQRAEMGVGLWVACVAVVVDSFFSGNFVMPMSQCWIAYLVGWTIAWNRGAAACEVSALIRVVPRRVVIALAIALMSSQFWLSWAVSAQVLNLDDYLDRVHTNIIRNEHDSPRFWSHGWF